MTNQWVCMTSTSEHSFVRDLGALSQRKHPANTELMTGLMRQRMVENRPTDEMDIEETFEVGERLLNWIDAYGKARGSQRSCWIGEGKRLKVTYSWGDNDSDEDDDDE